MTSLTRASKTQQRLSQQMVEKRLKHPDWFHVFSSDGEVKLNVQMGRLPAPERSLVADWAGASIRGTTMTLVFGQLPPGAPRMTGALMMQMPVRRVRETFLQPAFLVGVNAYAVKEGITPEPHTPTAELYPEERVVTERAQLVGIALGEDEAELRFYRASRSDFNAVLQEQEVDLVYPVIEVRMSTEEYVHLSKTLEDLTPPQRQLERGHV